MRCRSSDACRYLLESVEGTGRRGTSISNVVDKLPEPFFGGVPEFALPHDQDSPSRRAQHGFLACIAFRIGVEFQLPAFSIVCRICCIFASLVSVPEATVNENGNPVSWQDKVGRARQLARMKAVAESLRMQVFSNRDFRPSILGTDTLHHP